MGVRVRAHPTNGERQVFGSLLSILISRGVKRFSYISPFKNIIIYCMQTSQLSRFGRETHDFGLLITTNTANLTTNLGIFFCCKTIAKAIISLIKCICTISKQVGVASLISILQKN